MADYDIKKMELGAQQQQQQQQPPQAEALAVQVLDDHHRPQQEQAGVVIHQYVVSPTPSVRNDGARQCECCYPITTDDPVEVLQARTVAITHICVEAVGYFFCYSLWCGVSPFFAVLSSSIVACCCKTHLVYVIWGVMGGFVLATHVIAATTVFLWGRNYDVEIPVFFYVVSLILCGVNLLVMYIGRKAALAIMKRSIIPVESQVGTPLQLTYPATGVQPSTVTHVLPQSS